MHRRRFCPLVALLLLAWGAWVEAASFGPQRGRGGAVASAEAAATEVGLDILRRGGNAVDAAVAVAVALAVVHPEAGNLGGGGFALVRFEGDVYSLDFRETAPAGATPDMYLDDEGEKIPESSWIGPLATGVPGSPSGLSELHRRFGVLPWSDVVAPAIRLARGFTVSRRLADRIASKQDLLARFDETATVWLPGGSPPEPGSRMELPALAATLERYAERGSEAITTGPIAEAIVRTAARHGGILSAQDLAGYRPVWRRPLTFEAFGWSFASMDLPSSGGFLLAQGLALLERLGWRDEAPSGAQRAHLLAETWRRGYADRLLLGDPETTRASTVQLLDPAWLTERARAISRQTAAVSSETLPWSGVAPTEPADTTHLSVVDSSGNLVSLTTTLNGNFGCGLLVPEVGFLLNNEMDDFTTAPGRANEFGLVQGTANLVRPGRRMLSSTTPTVAWRDSEAIAIGGRGGSKIPTSTTQVLLGVIVDGLDLQRAVNRPRVHHQWLPDRILAEPDALSPETAADLEARGHVVYVEKDLGKLPKVHAVRLLSSGLIEAAADPRGPGVAGVVEPAPR